MNNPKICIVKHTHISCRGQQSDLSGHPLVYLAIDPRNGKINCPYCSTQFVLVADKD